MDLTGCWYNPNQDGSGLVIDDAPETRVVYWYTYANGLPGAGKGQIWMIGQPEGDDRNSLTFYRPGGDWLGKDYVPGEPVAYMTLSMDADTLVCDYRLIRLGPCRPVNVSPVWRGCGGRLYLQRLTRRA